MISPPRLTCCSCWAPGIALNSYQRDPPTNNTFHIYIVFLVQLATVPTPSELWPQRDSCRSGGQSKKELWHRSCVWEVWVHMCARVCAHVCTTSYLFQDIYMYIYIHVYIHRIYIHVYICTCICICTYICIHMCVCVYYFTRSDALSLSSALFSSCCVTNHPKT